MSGSLNCRAKTQHRHGAVRVSVGCCKQLARPPPNVHPPAPGSASREDPSPPPRIRWARRAAAAAQPQRSPGHAPGLLLLYYSVRLRVRGCIRCMCRMFVCVGSVSACFRWLALVSAGWHWRHMSCPPQTAASHVHPAPCRRGCDQWAASSWLLHQLSLPSCRPSLSHRIGVDLLEDLGYGL